MTNLTPVSSFDDVPQLETATLALGGPGGPMNIPAQALLNRTQWLHDNAVAGTAGPFGVDTGGLNACAVTFTPAITSIADGLKLRFTISVTNTGTATFSPNGLAAKPILGGSQSALQGGELIGGGHAEIVYDSTLDAWVIVAQSGGAMQVANAEASLQAVNKSQLDAQAAENAMTYTAISDLASSTAGKGADLVYDAAKASAVAAALGNPAGFQQAGTGSVLRTFQDKAGETRSIQDFGGRPDGGVTDNTAAFNAAKAAGVKRLTFPYGAQAYGFAGSSGIDFTNMELIGDGLSTVLDFTACTAVYPISATGSLTALPALYADVTIGSQSVTFTSAHGLVVGDAFVIHNPTASSFSGFRSYYNAGEFCEVVRVSGNTVYLKGNLWDSYVAAAVNIYKMANVGATLKAMTVLGGQTANGLLNLSLIRNLLIDKVSVYGAAGSTISIDRCFHGIIKPITVSNNTTNAPPANSYGIAIGNSQHVRVLGGSIFAPWSGTDFGGNAQTGNVPVRDCAYVGCTISSDASLATPQGAGMHGNTEYCGYIDCTIYNNCGMAGASAYLKDCRIYAINAGMIVLAGEILGGDYVISGCTLIGDKSDPQTSSRGYVDFGGNSLGITGSTTRDLTIRATDNVMQLSNASSISSAIRVINRGTTNYINVEVNGLSLRSNSPIYALTMDAASGGSNSKGICVDGLRGAPAGTFLASLGSYSASPIRMQRQSGKISFTTAAGYQIFPFAVTLPLIYPRVPVGSVSMSGSGGVSSSNIAGKTVSAFVRAMTGGSIQPAALTVDGTNATAGVVVDFNWSTEIAEC